MIKFFVVFGILFALSNEENQMKVIKRYLLFLLIFCFTININAVELTKPLIMDISRTYGYVTSQSLVAEKLNKKYPEISQELIKAQLEFNLRFKPSVSLPLIRTA